VGILHQRACGQDRVHGGDQRRGVARLLQELLRGGGGAQDRVPVGAIGEHDAGRVREPDPGLFHQRRAVQSGHPHIGDQDIDAVVRQVLQRRRSVLRAPHGPVLSVQVESVSQSREYLRLVVDEQDLRHDRAPRAATPPSVKCRRPIGTIRDVLRVRRDDLVEIRFALVLRADLSARSRAAAGRCPPR